MNKDILKTISDEQWLAILDEESVDADEALTIVKAYIEGKQIQTLDAMKESFVDYSSESVQTLIADLSCADYSGTHYRIKPRTAKTCFGDEVPAPMSEKPEEGDHYYKLYLKNGFVVRGSIWSSDCPYSSDDFAQGIWLDERDCQKVCNYLNRKRLIKVTE